MAEAIAAPGIRIKGSSFTPGSVPFASAAHQLTQDNANFFWDDTNKRLGIGSNSPQSQLYQLFPDGTGPAHEIDMYTNTATNFPRLTLRKGKGTVGAPAIVANGDDIGGIRFNAYDGAAFQLIAQIKASIDGVPGANDTPGRLLFFTTPDGSATSFERLRITNAGRFGVLTPSPQYDVDVNGQIHAAAFGSLYFHAISRQATTVAGTWGIAADAGQTDYDPDLTNAAAGYFTNNAVGLADLDEVTFGTVNLNAGQYYFHITYAAAANTGIIEVLIGATSLGTTDTYSGVLLNNQTTTYIFTPTVFTSGLLRLRVNGKNGLSTNFAIAVSRLEMMRNYAV